MIFPTGSEPRRYRVVGSEDETDRSMRKTRRDKTKVLSCFFGDCATHPEDGRLYRGGPSFQTEDLQNQHLKTHHQIILRKGNPVKFCDICSKWIIDPRSTQYIFHCRLLSTVDFFPLSTSSHCRFLPTVVSFLRNQIHQEKLDQQRLIMYLICISTFTNFRTS
jgi:hypothetical protein